MVVIRTKRIELFTWRSLDNFALLHNLYYKYRNILKK